jgi:hypothetical protein
MLLGRRHHGLRALCELRFHSRKLISSTCRTCLEQRATYGTQAGRRAGGQDQRIFPASHSVSRKPRRLARRIAAGHERNAPRPAFAGSCALG